MSNLRFCGDRMKNTYSETGKPCDSEIKEYDVYYKTNAFGYVIEDETSKIRRRKKDTDNACQNNLLRSKYEDQDNIIQISGEQKNENRAQIDSCLSENSNETLNSKYKYQDENVVERSHNKRGETKTQNISSRVPEKTLEMLKSKYEYQSDSTIETRNEERIERTTQYLSPESMEILRSKYKYQFDDDDATQINQNDKFESKIQDVSPASPRTAKERLRSEHNNENDYVYEASQKERDKNRTQDYSSSVSEKSFEERCPKRLVTCEFCEGKFFANEAEEHIVFCGSGTELCDVCDKYIMQKHKKKHFETGCNPRVSLPKSDSIERQKENEVSSRHLKRTHDSSTTSQNFFTAGRGVNKPPADYKNIERHWEQRTGAKPGEFLEFRSHTVCPICKIQIRWLDYNIHVPTCASSSGRCARCGKEVLDSDMNEHVLMKCSKISEISHVNVNERNFDQKRGKPKYSDSEIESESGSLCHKTNPKIFVSEIDLLSKHFNNLFTNENCWDTVVQVEDKEFKVHRGVLSARSSVFSAMFQHETTEKQTGIVTVPDCNADSFKLFLEYVYTGKLENISSNDVINLYTISDKYDVQELKPACIKFLMQNITVENISEVVIFADQYDEENLLSAIQNFFNKKFDEIILTEGWENLLKCNFRLANKLLIGKSKAEKIQNDV